MRNENVVPSHREIKREKLLPLRGKIATLKGNKKKRIILAPCA